MDDLRGLYTRSPIIERETFSPGGGPSESDYPTESPVLPTGDFDLTLKVNAQLWVKMRSALLFGALTHYELTDYYRMIEALNVAEQTGVNAMQYPQSAVLFWAAARESTLIGASPTNIPIPSAGGYGSIQQPFGVLSFLPNAGAAGQKATLHFTLAGGQYACSMLFVRQPSAGIISVRVDGTLVLSGIDLYSATVIGNQTQAFTAVMGAGAHTIEVECTGKRAAATAFVVPLTAFILRRSQ